MLGTCILQVTNPYKSRETTVTLPEFKPGGSYNIQAHSLPLASVQQVHVQPQSTNVVRYIVHLINDEHVLYFDMTDHENGPLSL